MKQTQPVSAPRNWITSVLFLTTFLVTITAVPYWGFTQGYDLSQWIMFMVFWLFCGMSITAGYHRLWSHKAYDANPVVRALLAFWGATALQNSILVWSSGHRRHHRHVDDNDRDPYSINRGFWFAHIGWMLRDYPSAALDFSNAKDLQKDPIVMFQHKHYIPLTLAGNVGLPFLLGLIHGDLIGTLLLVGFARIVVSHHTTFFINSLAHMWGNQPYTNTNTAKDNGFLAVFTYGEGYHNFHHYFQTDYRNGVRWYQWDPTKWLIASLSWVGLASNLKRVSDFKIQEALVQMQFEHAKEQLAKRKVHNAEPWRAALEKEYQQFLTTLATWKELRFEWYDGKRQAFEEKKQELQAKWETAAVRNRLKEMEYLLKMQRRRLQLFNTNFQALAS